MMKKLFVLGLLTAFVYACSDGDTKSTEEKKDSLKAETPAPAAKTSDKGLELVAQSDCTTCHKINEKNIGPAYMDVSKKYEATDANIDSLASKVINGGQGVWGTVPMTPHPDLSREDAKEMVKYVLSLKNQ
ncbi:MAG TPA: c-type cytochrome [Flavitalea sp.]|nr:c-type cytochrome [Flavitalea sp.]